MGSEANKLVRPSLSPIQGCFSVRCFKFHEASVTDQCFAHAFPSNSAGIVCPHELRASGRKTFVAAVHSFALSIADFASFEGYSEGGEARFRSVTTDLTFVHSSSWYRLDARVADVRSAGDGFS